MTTRFGYSIIQLVVGQMQGNCYLVHDLESNELVIIDPGDDGQYIIDAIEKLHATPTLIVATHGHFDHLMAAYEVQLAYTLPFAIHKRDAFLLGQMQRSAKQFLGIDYIDPPPSVTRELRDGETVTIGKTAITVVETPGHTPGSVSLLLGDRKALFVGDLLFSDGNIGRTDFSYSRPLDLAASVKKIHTFHPEIMVYSGHGDAFRLSDLSPL